MTSNETQLQLTSFKTRASSTLFQSDEEEENAQNGRQICGDAAIAVFKRLLRF